MVSARRLTTTRCAELAALIARLMTALALSRKREAMQATHRCICLTVGTTPASSSANPATSLRTAGEVSTWSSHTPSTKSPERLGSLRTTSSITCSSSRPFSLFSEILASFSSSTACCRVASAVLAAIPAARLRTDSRRREGKGVLGWEAARGFDHIHGGKLSHAAYARSTALPRLPASHTHTHTCSTRKARERLWRHMEKTLARGGRQWPGGNSLEGMEDKRCGGVRILWRKHRLEGRGRNRRAGPAEESR
mmetsp:Transcript_26998/g.76087  ORF Transcript_26998/g.76087 Transcript_26998/m.76087 type:complete len:252 (-) Transcript_26998:87-842(-)